ncbi:hypothetical protein [Yoonia sp.]|uniref:hypothetical protein n=1 Tax=Yoonia sp. TaxID=2212373 RepID=UPI003976E901
MALQTGLADMIDRHGTSNIALCTVGHANSSIANVLLLKLGYVLVSHKRHAVLAKNGGGA